MMDEELGLSNFQIDNHFKNSRFSRFYGGCLSKDELKNITPNDKFWIINLQDSTIAEGSHWVLVFDCVVHDHQEDFCIYFDPYGIFPHDSIVDFMEKSDKPLQYTYDTFQDIDSTKCGHYCIYVAESILKSVSYRKIFDELLDEHNIPANERLMKRVKLRK